MPGPPPKNPALRQRRNRTSTASTISRTARPRRVPPLPPRPAAKVCSVHGREATADAAGALRCSVGGHVLGEGEYSTRPGLAWHPMTLAWWRDVWRSEMAGEFLDSDRHGLYVLAELVDRFWYDPDADTANELRLQRQCFGLTPLDRRRLQWEVESSPATEARRPDAPKPKPPAQDPRGVLRFAK